MKTLSVIAFLVFLPWNGLAQEIYRWEDEKGVIHYGDAPTHKKASPFSEKTAPEPETDSRLREPPSAQALPPEGEQDEEPAADVRPEPPPSPSLIRTETGIDRDKRLHLFGIIYNTGIGICGSPSVEVTIIDEAGDIDGNFETVALLSEIRQGEEAEFAGKYFTPVGDSLSWIATPRCDSSGGMVYGPRKRGIVSLRR